jgi:hypothetical protein
MDDGDKVIIIDEEACKRVFAFVDTSLIYTYSDRGYSLDYCTIQNEKTKEFWGVPRTAILNLKKASKLTLILFCIDIQES